MCLTYLRPVGWHSVLMLHFNLTTIPLLNIFPNGFNCHTALLTQTIVLCKAEPCACQDLDSQMETDLGAKEPWKTHYIVNENTSWGLNRHGDGGRLLVASAKKRDALSLKTLRRWALSPGVGGYRLSYEFHCAPWLWSLGKFPTYLYFLVIKWK